MSRFICTYDVLKTADIALKNELKARGWTDCQPTGTPPQIVRLPNTTVVGDFQTLTLAQQSWDAAVAAAEKSLKTKPIVDKVFIKTISGAGILISNQLCDGTPLPRPQ